MTNRNIRFLRMEFSPIEHRHIRLAAAIGDESMTQFARCAVLTAAKAGVTKAFVEVGGGQSADRQPRDKTATTAANADQPVTKL